MGSFQQISLGIICLVAAFMFGNYVNHHPDPASVTTAFSEAETMTAESATSLSLSEDMVVQRAAPMDMLRDSTSTQQPTMKLPNLFGLANPGKTQATLPPPSQLDRPEESRSPTAPVRMPNLLDSQNRRQVMVPDFSQLAAEFQNTPLELPPMQKLETSPQTAFSERQSLSTGPSPFNRAAATDRQPALTPPVVSTFQPDDFAPKLKERFSPRPTAALESNPNITLPPPTEDGGHSPNDSG